MSSPSLCTNNEKVVMDHIKLLPIWSNIVFLFISIVAFVKKQYLLGIIGLLVAIISTIHHTFNTPYYDTSCDYKKENDTTMDDILSYLDIIFVNISCIVALYLYIKHKQYNSEFILPIILFGVVGIGLFIYSLIISDKAKQTNEKNNGYNSDEQIKYDTLYDIYHALWHIFASFVFLVLLYGILF